MGERDVYAEFEAMPFMGFIDDLGVYMVNQGYGLATVDPASNQFIAVRFSPPAPGARLTWEPGHMEVSPDFRDVWTWPRQPFVQSRAICNFVIAFDEDWHRAFGLAAEREAQLAAQEMERVL